ncbi:MAG: hypothetical protein HY718_07770, partial [Planctomycetes bacterium]|nr:hypothetical protein [Planctomycetota bacterium]
MRMVTVVVAVGMASAAFAGSDAPAPEILPDTAALTGQGDLAAEMVAGIGRYLDRELAAAADRRPSLWHPDYSSAESYIRSIVPNRLRLARIIGAVDERIAPTEMELVGTTDTPATVAETDAYAVLAVRWPVLPGVDGEGLLLEPKAPAAACVVAIPDADQTPEMLAGLTAGLPTESQFARRLAENGCRVIVPVLLDRSCEWSGNPRLRMTNQTHREWIYRMSYEVGRHIIGYEVQKVLAAVDWFAGEAARAAPSSRRTPIGVFGYGEGGLIALYDGALSSRIDATAVSGYFRSRQFIWQEPVYRNVWSLLTEFGDADIAGLIAPRALIVEAGRGPEVPGPPKLEGHHEAAPGALATPPLDCANREFNRAKATFDHLGAGDRIYLVEAGEDAGPGTDEA